MAFVLQVPQTKRVKHIDQSGKEEADEQSRAAFQAAAVAAAQANMNFTQCSNQVFADALPVQ